MSGLLPTAAPTALLPDLKDVDVVGRTSNEQIGDKAPVETVFNERGREGAHAPEKIASSFAATGDLSSLVLEAFSILQNLSPEILSQVNDGNDTNFNSREQSVLRRFVDAVEEQAKEKKYSYGDSRIPVSSSNGLDLGEILVSKNNHETTYKVSIGHTSPEDRVVSLSDYENPHHVFSAEQLSQSHSDDSITIKGTARERFASIQIQNGCDFYTVQADTRNGFHAVRLENPTEEATVN